MKTDTNEAAQAGACKLVHRLWRFPVEGDRETYLESLCSGLRVLHLGCAHTEVLDRRLAAPRL